MRRATHAGHRLPRLLLAAVLVVVGLSGCFKASQDVKVKADGTGTVVLHAELDKRALAAVARSFGGSPPDLGAPQFQLVDRTFPDGTRVRTGDDAERSVLDASFDFDGSDDYLRKMEQINEAIAPGSDEPTPSGSLEVRRVGEQLEVALDLGDGREDLDAFDLGRLIGVLSADARPSATVTITMPGRIRVTNGTATGRTATWDLLASGAPSTLTVSSDIARAGLPGWVVPAAAGLMLALILGIVGVLLSRRAQRPGESVVPVRPAPAQPATRPGTFFPAPPPGPAPAGPFDRPLEPQPGAPPGTLDPARPPGWPSRGPDVPTPPPWAPQPQPWPVTWPPGPPAPAEPARPDSQRSTPAASPDEAAAVATGPGAGWYPDPAGGGGVRYWDGTSWTHHTH